jgi:hypothetical protein
VQAAAVYAEGDGQRRLQGQHKRVPLLRGTSNNGGCTCRQELPS